MALEYVDILGLFAGAVILAGYIPQIYKVYITKKMYDVSKFWLWFLVCGSALWLLYGYLKADLILIVVNATGLALTSTLLALKYRYGLPTHK